MSRAVFCDKILNNDNSIREIVRLNVINSVERDREFIYRSENGK